jgi:hypothetical protein
VALDDDGPEDCVLWCIHMKTKQLKVWSGVLWDILVGCGGCSVLRVACSSSGIHTGSGGSVVSLISVGHPQSPPGQYREDDKHCQAAI